VSDRLEVLATGPLATVQDLGRPGYAHWGVSRSGAADRASARLANRLVGNPEAAATVEVTFGGLHVRATGDLLVSVTGPRARGATADRRERPGRAPLG
jgi:allophanate hydrolase subunit 2